MTTDHVDSLTHEQPRRESQGKVTGTGTPAEDREEEWAKNQLWNLKEDAKWGKDTVTQKKAIQELGKMGTPALSHLEEIWSIVPSVEIKQCCLDAINRIVIPQPNETTSNR